jgi:hypothetical protein
VVVLWVIAVLVFGPEERHHSVVVFRADWRVVDNGTSIKGNRTCKKKSISPLLLEMYCSVSAVEDAVPAEVHPSALVGLDLALA